MDVILTYTDSNHVDVGDILASDLDWSAGTEENDFLLTVDPAATPELGYNSLIYMEGDELGGIIDAMEGNSGDDTITWKGRTWTGILASKIVRPDDGVDYLSVEGDANAVIAWLLSRYDFGGLFVAETDSAGIGIKYRFARYCNLWEGISGMLAQVGARLSIRWNDGAVRLAAERIADYTDDMLDDDDDVLLDVEHTENKINHLICLGAGELKERTVIDLYADKAGNISKVQTIFGLEEIAATYDYPNAESAEALEEDGRKRLKELRDDGESAVLTVQAESVDAYRLGDRVAATLSLTGETVADSITQRIVKISGGRTTAEYKVSGG